MTDLQAKYRLIFCDGGVGEEVLADILTKCHLGETLNPENPAQIAEYNVGIYVLSMIGAFAQGTRQGVVHALAEIRPGDDN